MLFPDHGTKWLKWNSNVFKQMSVLKLIYLCFELLNILIFSTSSYISDIYNSKIWLKGFDDNTLIKGFKKSLIFNMLYFLILKHYANSFIVKLFNMICSMKIVFKRITNTWLIDGYILR
jgi:hypothetical protein